MARKRTKKWAQSVATRIQKKGTSGAFRAYCKRHGFSKVTQSCVNMGKRSKSALTRKRATLAGNFLKMHK